MSLPNAKAILPLESESHAISATTLLLAPPLLLLRLLLILGIALLVNNCTALSA